MRDRLGEAKEVAALIDAARSGRVVNAPGRDGPLRASDIGADTGKMSELLARGGLFVAAVEPSEEILTLGTTRSSYIRSSEAGRARMQANMRWYLYEHLGYTPGETVTIPYTTLVWLTHL